jgi:predicted nucleic acid-binding protein
LDRIYLDLCCLKRPFDDQRQERIRREAEAVAWILEQAENGSAIIVRSPALTIENDANPREDRRLAAAVWLQRPGLTIPHSPAIAKRARELNSLGFGVLDGLHLAYAEAAEARWFVTCDDGLSRTAQAHRESLVVAVIDPCRLQQERHS